MKKDSKKSKLSQEANQENEKKLSDLKNLTGEERPEVCSIEHVNSKLENLPGEERPQVCGIAPADSELKNLPDEKRPEVCSIEHANPKLENLPGEEHPQVCGIAPAGSELENLPGEKHPEVCSIERVNPKLENLPGEEHPQVCGINRNLKEPDVCSIHPEERPQRLNIRSDRENLEHENIADTYGFNVPVSPQERQKLLEKLAEEAPRQTESNSNTTDLNTPMITIVKNGPYIVRGNIPVLDAAIKTNSIGQSVGWEEIRDLEDKKTVALCRCGRSKNMPFCDESHLKVHFDGTCTASNKPYNEAANIYRGAPGYYLMDEESLCAIVRFCDPDGSCWNLIKSAQTVDIAIDQTYNCCSGRLTVIKDEKKCEPDLKQEIECVYDTERDVLGPLWIKGRIPVKSAETDYEVRNRVTLCRCGRSYNKPFCDGMHLTCPKLSEEEKKKNE